MVFIFADSITARACSVAPAFDCNRAAQFGRALSALRQHRARALQSLHNQSARFGGGKTGIFRRLLHRLGKIIKIGGAASRHRSGGVQHRLFFHPQHFADGGKNCRQLFFYF